MKKDYTVGICKPTNEKQRFYVFITKNNKIIKKIYKGINHNNNFEDKLKSALILKNLIETKLKNGWIVEAPEAEISKLNFREAILFGFESKKNSLSERSIKDYRCCVNFVLKTAKDLNIERLPIVNTERFHLKKIFESLKIYKNWTAKNYNKHLGILKSIFSELVEWEHIPYNPLREIKKQKEIKTEGYLQLTEIEHQTVFSHLKKIDYNFYIFCSFAYYLGIRPKELLSVKCKSVNIEHQTITVEVGTSKNRKMRVVPLIGTTLELLKNFDISNSDFYLFGTYLKTGGRPNLKNYLCPNPYMIKRDTVTKLWHKYIILGLGINKNLYSLKHKGANDKMKAGIDLKTISSIFGHSSEKITEIYATHINNLRFEEAKKVKLNEY